MTTIARVTIARQSAPVAAAAAGELDAVLIPWNDEREVTDDGRTVYRESWQPGSLVAPDGTATVYGMHVQTPRGLERGPIVGIARNITAGPDGLTGTIHLGTDEGRRIHELATLGVRVAMSIEADVDAAAPDGDGRVIRTAERPATLTGLATILPPQNPAYPGALVTAVRAAPDGDTDPDPATDDEEEKEDPDKENEDVTDTDTTDTTETVGRAAVAELVRTEVARMGLQRGGRAPAVHPLARFSSAVEMLIAARTAPPAEQAEITRDFQQAYALHREIARALVDQITPDNPGVLPPTWLSTVFGVVDSGRPGITAMGGPASAGDSGLDINWPYYDGDLTTLVGEQAVEKTDIVSVKVSFKRGTATLKTYAGGSDVSYQLQRRSSPSYMAAYNRLLQTSYGLITEMVFDAAILAGAGATVVYDPSATDTDGAKFKAFLFSASAKVKKATGMPATAVLVSSDVYGRLGGQPWLQPPMYGTQNVPGTAAASTLKINVSGLDIVEAPGMAAGNLVVSNSEAARWFEDGPFLVTSEDVAKLGTDAAIWGMGTTGITIATGVVKASATAARGDKS